MSPSRKSSPLKILVVGTEADSFAKVGGLGEVISALTRALRARGHDARVFMPKYATIRTSRISLVPLIQGLRLSSVQRDPYGLTVSNVLRHRSANGAVTYLLENMEYYEKRANVYGYTDDTVRWVLLCRGVLEFIRRSEWVPDVIVANDWQTGFIPNLMSTEYADDPVIKKIASVFVIHNLRHQGMFDVHFVKDADYDLGTSPLPDVLDPSVPLLNGMRRGILHADAVSTVSPTYAQEILQAELGERLDDILRQRKDRLAGILNGIDVKKYNPATDRYITRRYSADRLAPRTANKQALQRRYKLPQRKDAFVVGFVGRLDEQKGINLFMQIARPLLKNLDIQFVSVGTGEKDYRMFFKELQQEFPAQSSSHLFFDDGLAKRIFAGADAILMPSRFEPSGLVQMEAMRYGAVPIVRKTGGLADTVTDDSPGTHGTGFVFREYEPLALLIAVVRAYTAFRDRRHWHALVRRCMKQDFSWSASAARHARLYRRAIRLHQDRRRSASNAS